MNRRIFYLSCIALLSLVFCKRKDEIDSKPPTTELTTEPKKSDSTDHSTGDDSPPAESTLKFVNIPDVNFRAYLKRLPALKGAFTGDRLNAADKSVISLENLKVSGEEIKDLSGIAYFTALKELDCSTNALTDLDLSQNQALTALHCQNNQLKALDLTHNNHLKSLEFFGNDDLQLEKIQLGYLDEPLEINTGPEGSGESFVAFPDKNFRDYLKVHTFYRVKPSGLQLTFRGDWLALDPENLKYIIAINLRYGKINVRYTKIIKDLSGIEYFTNLKILECYDKELTSLDVSQNRKLEALSCYNNKLKSLDVRANTHLKELLCYKNQLTSLDVSQNQALTTLSCDANALESLNVRANTELMRLYCTNNKFTSLDVSQNPNLTELLCSNNSLGSLDVRANTELTSLFCYRNKLTSLDVSQNRKLTILYCSNNSLGSLDLSQNPKVKDLECINNKLTSLVLSPIGAQNFAYLNYSGNPGLKPEKIIWGDLPKKGL